MQQIEIMQDSSNLKSRKLIMDKIINIIMLISSHTREAKAPPRQPPQKEAARTHPNSTSCDTPGIMHMLQWSHRSAG